jgi:hypothetical protein
MIRALLCRVSLLAAAPMALAQSPPPHAPVPPTPDATP